MGYGNGETSSGEGGVDITNFDPTQGAAIDPFTKIAFDVVAPAGIASIVVIVRYTELGASEVAYDRRGFSSGYASRSSRVDAEGVAHFVLGRKGGWNASPTIAVEGADTLGNAFPEVT